MLGQLETRLTGVVVAALKEAFDRDRVRMDLRARAIRGGTPARRGGASRRGSPSGGRAGPRTGQAGRHHGAGDLDVVGGAGRLDAGNAGWRGTLAPGQRVGAACRHARQRVRHLAAHHEWRADAAWRVVAVGRRRAPWLLVVSRNACRHRPAAPDGGPPLCGAPPSVVCALTR